MNGPEHYAEAERLLERSGAVEREVSDWQVAKAQVHATLALAAAQMSAAEIVAGPSKMSFVNEHRHTVFQAWEVAR